MPTIARKSEVGALRAAALLLALALLGGCAAALRPPPPLRTIGEPATSATSPQGNATTPQELGALLAEAAVQFARRPDAAAVSAARDLYLRVARGDESDVEGLLGAARAGAWLVEQESDRDRRVELATAGVQICQWCVERAPERIDCDYRLALALGQQARERPATATDALPRIVGLLEKVIATAPALDEAGGHRVLALVLLRAPAWPLGPGDPEQGLTQARAAVAVAPDYPPNLLALSEAFLANGRPDEAHRLAIKAGRLADERLAGGDPDASAWVDQAARAAAAPR